MTSAADFTSGRPIVFRNATVLTIDPNLGVIKGGDVLVSDRRIAAVGKNLAVPDGTAEIDASDGILMPGMVDTHRHMWQTAQRGFGADWTLTNYFMYYYINWGKIYRPEDVYAGNLLSAIEAVDAGVTTSLDWSHGLRTIEHGEAALDALEEVPGRFVLAYGNIFTGPWDWSNSPEFRDFVKRRIGRNDLVGFKLAFDVTGDPAFPEKAAFEAARELGVGVTTHAGVWKVTSDLSIQQIDDAGFMTPNLTCVHSASLSDDSYQRIAAGGAYTSISSESEASAGQGYSPTYHLRKFGIPVSLSMDTSVWWSADLFSAMRATLDADRAHDHMAAHEHDETIVNNYLRSQQVVEWATMGGAKALGMDSAIGSVTPGKRADLVLIKNDNSPTMFPIINPYGHVVFQAGRGDVHTVVVDGRVLKYDGHLKDINLSRAKQAIAQTVEYMYSNMGEAEIQAVMNPDQAKVELLDNPYTYKNKQ
jgi:cytosine/adenosine deaminase-related metal-dependent hydrolase